MKPKKPMTKNGYTALAQEFLHLKDHERPKIVDNMATAAAEGDRSENAEYIYSKKRLREIDKRLHYLTKLLDDVQIVDPDTITSNVVCFGSTVTVKNEANENRDYTIVGVGEIFDTQSISCESVVAKALLGKKPGEAVEYETPDGQYRTLEIMALKFGKK